MMTKESLDALKGALNRRKVIFVCIGTPTLTMDCFAPKLGTVLDLCGYTVYGTEDDPIERPNIKQRLKDIKRENRNKYIFAIDSAVALDDSDHKLGEIIVEEKGLAPGAYMGDVHLPYGNACMKYVSMKDYTYVTKKQVEKAVQMAFELINANFDGGRKLEEQRKARENQI